MASRKPNKGVALLEVMVSLTLVAIILVLLTKTQIIGAQLATRSVAESEFVPLYTNRIELREMLSGAPPKLSMTNEILFIGTGDGFSFWPGNGETTPTRVEFTDGSLSMTRGNSRKELISNSNWVEFEYLSAENSWQPDWDDQQKLPKLIRISASDGSIPNWPMFVVAPRLAQ